MSKKNNEKIKIKEEKHFRGIIVLYISICLLIIVFCFQYYTKLNETIHDESKSYLQEVAMRIGSNIDRIIDDNYAVLYTMVATLETVETDSLAEVRTILKEQQVYWNYQNIMLVDDKGTTYDLEGNEVFVDIDNTIRQAFVNKERTMSTTQIVNNKECIIFYVPVNDLVIEGKNMVAMAASYDPGAFDKVLSMSSFGEMAYSQIVLKNGTTVIRSTSPYALKGGYNIFSTLQNVDFYENDKLETVKEDILSDVAGQIAFELDGLRRYMVYTPIQPDEWYLLTFVPVEVVNAKSDMLLRTTILFCGFITLAFAGLIAALLYTSRNNRIKLERIAYVDDVTGGNTVQKFYRLASNLLENTPESRFALIYSNFAKFKVLNEQMGRQNCDKILWYFYDFLNSTLEEGECMGRVSGDNFCVMLKYIDESTILKRITLWYDDAEEYAVKCHIPWALPATEFGIYVIEDRELPLAIMIDRAKLALKENSNIIDGKLKCAFYDDNIRRQLFREKQLEDIMKQALDSRQFKVFLQPKYHVQEETIGGAEALVRWENPEEGMIFPNEFIPLFEKNGFIVQLDLWVFEDVCRTMRLWMENGLELMRVSVNCSRIHFKDINFLSHYIRIADKYAVPKDMLEIELTESVVLENVERLTKIIDDIHEAGFMCSMDDFGSGYSSLNMIQSIPVDTLKLDKIFFKDGSSNIERTEAVVGSIVMLAQALNMTTVAEGVEHREQVDMLKRVGCDYIQGYVFAKPMNLTAFEELAFGKSVQ